MVDFINNEYGGKIKTGLDSMAGRGILTEHLLCIDGLEELVINDLAEDCHSHLQNKFASDKRVKGVLNCDFFRLNLEKETDLVVVDFNNFTWNKKEQVRLFLDWVKRNRDFFSFLLYSDSFHYSLKFLKDKTQARPKYQTYLNSVEESLSMKLLTDCVYKNKDCSLILLKNK